MENEEVIQLRKLKEKLLKKAIQLKDKLKDQEDKHQSLINITLPSDNEDHKSSKPQSIKYKTKLCEIAGQVMGITFKDINKKWLHNNTFIYTAKVITKTFSFNLELTVVFADTHTLHLDYFKIDNIMCYFTNIDDCYMLEISPWFEKITNIKNFPLLISALSDYIANNNLRSKILNSLKSRKYATVQQYTQENGGILVYIHSSMKTEENYLIFQWTMKFLELTWHIEHFFIVKPTNIGIKFSEENRTLLKQFCEIGLTKNKLVELWDRLCIAIDNYTEEINA
ncbi:uncharacterized protein LOC105250177 [Camponotus floridanus]|nr:uncharacterized protein LOC105250177 [Camponotus floridanus]